MGSLPFTVKVWTCGLNIHVVDTKVMQMPMELGYELIYIINSYCMDAKKELFNNMVYKIDRIGLCVPVIPP